MLNQFKYKHITSAFTGKPDKTSASSEARVKRIKLESNVQLNTRFGGGGQNPSKEEMKAAIQELFMEDNPNCTVSDYAEHPEAFLSYGHDNPDEDEYIWTEYTVTINRNKKGIFTKYKDQDDDEPEFEYVTTTLSQDNAIELWNLLSEGKVDEIEIYFKKNS